MQKIINETAAYAMSCNITSLYGLPNDHAVVACLPEIWEYMTGHMDMCLDSSGQEDLGFIFNEITHSMGRDKTEKAIAVFCEMMNIMEMKNPVAGNREDKINVLSHSVNPVRLKNYPVEMDEVAIVGLYSIILS